LEKLVETKASLVHRPWLNGQELGKNKMEGLATGGWEKRSGNGLPE
jgi:hypothetical protein